MSPGAIAAYTERVRTLLRDSSYRPVPAEAGGDNPYVLFPTQQSGPGISFVVAYLFAMTPEMEAEKEAWLQMVRNFNLSFGLTHPTCAIAALKAPAVKDGRHFPLAMAKTYAQVRRSMRGNLLFADVDIVAYNPCDPFENDFDVGLTDCDDLWQQQPFNAGIQFYKDTPAAQKYLDTVMEIAWCIPGNSDPWYAQQIAMGIAYHMLKDEVNFKVFPHERYNFTPEGLRYERTDAYFVHARGPRKNLHFEYTKALVERLRRERSVS